MKFQFSLSLRVQAVPVYTRIFPSSPLLLLKLSFQVTFLHLDWLPSSPQFFPSDCRLQLLFWERRVYHIQEEKRMINLLVSLNNSSTHYRSRRFNWNRIEVEKIFAHNSTMYIMHWEEKISEFNILIDFFKCLIPILNHNIFKEH